MNFEQNGREQNGNLFKGNSLFCICSIISFKWYRYFLLVRRKYDNLVCYFSGGENVHSEESLPLIRKLIEKHPQPFSYYEWKYGEAPERTETLSLTDLLADEKAKKGDEAREEDEIDFGDDELDGEIDFGEDIPDTGKPEFDIEVIGDEEELRKGTQAEFANNSFLK